MEFPQEFIHLSSRKLWKPMIDPRKKGKNDPGGHHIMKVADDIIGVMEMDVRNGKAQWEARQTAHAEHR